MLTRTLYHAVTKSKLMHKASNAFNSNTAIDCSFSQDVLSGNCLITTHTHTSTLNQKYITGWMTNRVCETVHVLTTFYLLALSIKGTHTHTHKKKTFLHGLIKYRCIVIYAVSTSYILFPLGLTGQHASFVGQYWTLLTVWNKTANMYRLYTKQQHKYLPQTGLVHSHRQLS